MGELVTRQGIAVSTCLVLSLALCAWPGRAPAQVTLVDSARWLADSARRLDSLVVEADQTNPQQSREARELQFRVLSQALALYQRAGDRQGERSALIKVGIQHHEL